MVTKLVNGHEEQTSAYYNLILDLEHQFKNKSDADLLSKYMDAMTEGM